MSSPSKRRGAIGVIAQDGKLLVIERSAHVRAPGKFCFPGGGIKDGESEQVALVRELQEEMNVTVRPLRRLWRSHTQSGVELLWWHAEMLLDEQPVPNPAEVADFSWMSPEEMIQHPQLLLTNREFLVALRRGAFSWGGPDPFSWVDD